MSSQQDLSKYKGPIAWMAKNSVASNLFMFILLFAGAIGLLQTKQEVLPEFDLDIIQVIVPYPGAAPEEAWAHRDGGSTPQHPCGDFARRQR